ncbi:hypothetical protein CDL15_Pgr016023 [Punica granatum]|uniref:Peroxidase n=1 Tax=Punica granatum TaxID=22663 RepID=A0A218XQP4_PUNGR|nr:hypothetical protein CDL15_Pgr016023 [Punica granatum]
MQTFRAPSFILAVSMLLMAAASARQLRADFNNNTCLNAEHLVRSAVTRKFQLTDITAPATLRHSFHDCFVRGCDASVLLASPNNDATTDHPIDLSLAGNGFDTVIKDKAVVDSYPQCRNKVSYADILALATRDVISLAGVPFYHVELGRRDGRISTKASVEHGIPLPTFDLVQLNTNFGGHGLSQTDMIALSGGHTIGISNCSHVFKRIYNFNLTHPIDSTLNLSYARHLRDLCPRNVDPNKVIDMDSTTTHIFDNAYFKNLQNGTGLFSSDQVLFTDPRSRPTVNFFASNDTAFREAFKTAMTKLGRVGVLTGSKGEIRINCTRPN